MYLRKTCRVFFVVLLSLVVICTFVVADQHREDGFFYLKGMEGELLLGQEAKSDWGEFWSAPTVTAINLGYFAMNGYPALVPDSNGSGVVDRPDLIELADTLGNEEYMKTGPATGTPDPNLLYGLAKYVDRKYPGEFEIKVYESGFRNEYSEEMGQRLPDELFSIPIRLYPNPLFADYMKELEDGEVVWLGLPSEMADENHFLAGRSFDQNQKEPGRYLVDLVEPKGRRQTRADRARVIETIMREKGQIRYGERFIPVDIMFALSPVEKECLPDLVCTVDCETREERVCVEQATGGCQEVCVEEECRGWCTNDQQERWCCEGYECLEWDTVCGESDECLEWETRYTYVCRVVTENQGCSTAGLSTGTLTLKAVEKETLRHFLNTDLAPGEKQVSLLQPKLFRYNTAVCNVDIYDDVKESDEKNNEGTEELKKE